MFMRAELAHSVGWGNWPGPVLTCGKIRRVSTVVNTLSSICKMRVVV